MARSTPAAAKARDTRARTLTFRYVANAGQGRVMKGTVKALSEVAADQGRWEFMLTLAPMPIPRGTGSPVNPIAIF